MKQTKKAVEKKASGQGVTVIHMHLRADLHERIKKLVLVEGITQRYLIEQALEAMLEQTGY